MEDITVDTKYYIGVGLCLYAGLADALGNIIATKLNRYVFFKH